MKGKTEEKNNKNIRNKIVALVLSVFSLFILIGIGFAYFSVVASNTNNETLTAGSATLSLVFDDNDNGISGTLNLGEAITKKFTLENTGTNEVYARINWLNMINTYTPQSLSFNLARATSENGTYTTVAIGNVPTSASQVTRQLKDGILVPANTKYYYKLTILLNNLNINQNSDINATFSSHFNIEESEPSLATNEIMNMIGSVSNTSTSLITLQPFGEQSCTYTLGYDRTNDNNLRYVGANPCNYVSFNNELWRIIGVMNNVDDGTGNSETRIKLVRKDILGSYSWDSSDSSVNDGLGINNWAQADLKNELNGDYINTSLNENTYWYSKYNNVKGALYYYTSGLKTTAINQIGDVKWYLGGRSSSATANGFYTSERGTSVYSGNATTWNGKVALMYPSDFGFATGDNRSMCLNTALIDYDNGCYQTNWTYKSGEQQPLLTHYSGNCANCIFGIYSGGYVYHYLYTYAPIPVRPVVYLKANTSIIGGMGTQSNPYILK